MTFENEVVSEYGVNIKVIGIGGGGVNAINRMMASGQAVSEKVIGTDEACDR